MSGKEFRKNWTRYMILACSVLIWSEALGAQIPQQPSSTPQQPTVNPGVNQVPGAAPGGAPSGIPPMAERLRPTYVLQVGDQILVRARDVEELSERPFRIESDGSIRLPLAGPVNAAGLTVEALEAAIAKALSQFVVNPQVSVTVTQFKTDPVFVVGAFRAPGVYPLSGRRNLVDLLSSIGGLAPNAGRRIKVTRRMDEGKPPLPNGILTPDGKYASLDVNIVSLQTTVNSLEDIELQAYDIISAERAEMIFTAGAMSRVGGIEIGERESLSITQVLSLSGGYATNALPEKAYILRPVMNSARRAEIPVNLKRILRGESNDVPLLPNDVLYVPSTIRRMVIERAASAGVGLLTGVLLFQVFN